LFAGVSREHLGFEEKALRTERLLFCGKAKMIATSGAVPAGTASGMHPALPSSMGSLPGNPCLLLLLGNNCRIRDIRKLVSGKSATNGETRRRGRSGEE
jgi:hypothetical protein